MLKRTSLIALLALCFGSMSWAQPICDGPFTWGNCPRTQTDQQITSPEERGTENNPTVVKVIRRATTIARFIPGWRAIFMPQASSHDHLMVRVSRSSVEKL
jgi:hypothetical protein